MLQRTFQHIPGVGPWREKDLWARGIRTWSDFPGPGEGVVLSAKADPLARERLAQGREALERRDLRTLAALIPPRELWRLYPEFAEDAVFFDIETDAATNAQPTVVSLFHSGGLELFIQGRNMDDVPAALSRHSLWVTFNGSCYDVPVLRQYFGSLPEPAAHIDLRFVCRRFGMGGGLKEIEDKLGMGRPPHLKGARGWDAVLLWRAYRARADLEALRFLAEYNLYDTFQLRSLMERVFNHAVDELSQDVPYLKVFERGDVLYDVSRMLLELGPTPQDNAVLERVRALESGA